MIQAWLQGQSTSDLHGGGPTHLWSESQKSDGEHFERQNLGGTQVRFPSSSLQTLLYFSLQSVLVPHSFNSLQLFSTSRNWVFEQTVVSFVSLQTFASPSTCWQVFAFSRCSQSLLHEQVTEEVGSLEIWEKSLATCWCDRVTFSPRSFSAYMVARLVCKSWTPPFPCQLILGKMTFQHKRVFLTLAQDRKTFDFQMKGKTQKAPASGPPVVITSSPDSGSPPWKIRLKDCFCLDNVIIAWHNPSLLQNCLAEHSSRQRLVA